MDKKNDRKSDNKVIDINKARKERRPREKKTYDTSEYKTKKVTVRNINDSKKGKNKKRVSKENEKNKAGGKKKVVKGSSINKYEKRKINNKKNTTTNKQGIKRNVTGANESTSSKNKKKKQIKKKNLKRRLTRVIICLVMVLFLGYKGIGIINNNKSEKDEKQAVISSEQAKKDSKEDKNVEASDKKDDTEDKEGNINLDKRYKIVIDAGNGGEDKGAVDNSGKIYGKDLNMQVARKVAAKLSSEEDVNVIMTRIDDKNIDIKDRAAIAKDKKADIVVSIHMNTRGKNNEAEGMETWYKDGDEKSKKLAGYIQNSLDAYVTAKSRGILPANKEILEKTKVPTVMVECGFISDDKEVKNLKNTDYQNNLADGIVQGILGYVDSISDDK